jgi:hypothetical protein
MDIKDLQNVKAPFDVLSIKDGSRHTIKGFAQNDPLGVGGGFFPDMPVVYFEGGGWLLVSDLLRHYEIAPNKACTGRAKRGTKKKSLNGKGGSKAARQ